MSYLLTRSRRQVWISGDMADLLKVAAPMLNPAISEPHEMGATQHTPDTLLETILREYFQRPENLRFARLSELKKEHERLAEEQWKQEQSSPPS